MGLEGEIERLGAELGLDQVGFCKVEPAAGLDHYRSWLKSGFHADMDYLDRSRSIKANPTNLLPGARSIIAVAQNYYQDVPDEAPRIARYAIGRDYHKVLRGKLKRLSQPLLDAGHHVRACVDSAPILEREYAHMAGLGWFGKNTMLINSKRGSWFFIGLVLTDADLETSKPALGGCGTCRECINACPTGAIVQLNGRWSVDSRLCLSYQTIENADPMLAELSAKSQGWVFGCDICQEVCPFNHPRPTQPQRATRTQEADFLTSRSTPSLPELATMDQGTWDDWTRGRALRRANVDKWRSTTQALLQTTDGE